MDGWSGEGRRRVRVGAVMPGDLVYILDEGQGRVITYRVTLQIDG